MWFLCIFIISVYLCHGILDGMTCSEVGAVKLRLEEEKEKRLMLQNEVEILMLKVANLERKLAKDADGSSSRSRNVAFMVYRNTSLTNLELKQKLVFVKVAMNVGNGYSAITGVFTASVSGIYFFIWMTSHAMGIVSPDTDLITIIVVNGEYKVHAGIAITHGFHMGGNSAVF
ncbi:hypothetical protein CHS0354_033032 [Potamilus streckersoni]|uniref:C1q domain-containing protein n=1 Tax=Potamilus streckersoni TaxID=2493646 RepID=A0AAE0VLI9_9BIVA|nr:hypothetical protein CHS0354_033032 [Potamilus streckersoni]